jgi:hypothetical protein
MGNPVGAPAEASSRQEARLLEGKKNPFTGTREFNGLRVLMALLSNWNLKDVNNAIYAERDETGSAVYEVSDLGTSFGMSGESYTASRAKNNLGVPAVQVHIYGYALSL